MIYHLFWRNIGNMKKNYQVKYNKSNIITVTDKKLLSKTSRHPIIKNLSNRNYIIT